jgi:hypothetical protein
MEHCPVAAMAAQASLIIRRRLYLETRDAAAFDLLDRRLASIEDSAWRIPAASAHGGVYQLILGYDSIARTMDESDLPRAPREHLSRGMVALLHAAEALHTPDMDALFSHYLLREHDPGALATA